MEHKRKLAIVFHANLFDCKGLTNAIINRIKYLQKIADYEIDVYALQPNTFGLSKIIWGESNNIYGGHFELSGVSMNVLKYKNFALDNFLSHRLNMKPILEVILVKRFCRLLKDYDIISAHSFLGGLLALRTHKKYKIPFFVSWHGSDIHTVPARNHFVRRETVKILKYARCNFFVSEALANDAKKIVADFPYKVLYNGISPDFMIYQEERRHRLRLKYGVANSKVVVFAGNIIPIKNPLVLPDIFRCVADSYEGDVAFWIIGDGELRKSLETKMKDCGIDATFWGNVNKEAMPGYLQCANVVILSSLNEGFGLVLLEALKCGANAVASRVGGTLEILGEENTFRLDDSFVKKISERIVFMLNNNVPQPINPMFSWEHTAKMENQMIVQSF